MLRKRFASSRASCASVVEALEGRQLLAATVANFTGGNGTASVDQFRGAIGSGWATAWSTPSYTGNFTTATVATASPLNR